MAEYIEREALLLEAERDSNFNLVVRAKTIQNFPAADVVSKAVHKQVAWERDLAIQQLKGDYGVGLGEKKKDVAPVRHGRCSVCNGKTPIIQDCDNGYSIDVEGEEMSVWDGDKCVAIFHINYCPMCGCEMGLEDET